MSIEGFGLSTKPEEGLSSIRRSIEAVEGVDLGTRGGVVLLTMEPFALSTLERCFDRSGTMVTFSSGLYLNEMVELRLLFCPGASLVAAFFAARNSAGRSRSSDHRDCGISCCDDELLMIDLLLPVLKMEGIDGILKPDFRLTDGSVPPLLKLPVMSSAGPHSTSVSASVVEQ